MADATMFSMPRILRSVLFAAICCLVTACASSNLAVMTVSNANSEIVQGYLIDAGDKLKVTVFGEDTLSGEYEVGSGGVMALPLLEPIAVKDLTPGQVAKRIEQKLAEGGYVLYPKASVEILEHRSFFILGQVATPGEYPHNGELTLEQAVAKAGGYTPRADKGSVILRRQDWSESKLIELGGTALKIAPGDTINVQESFF